MNRSVNTPPNKIIDDIRFYENLPFYLNRFVFKLHQQGYIFNEFLASFPKSGSHWLKPDDNMNLEIN